MKKLINYVEVREIIEKRKNEHIDAFCDYRYRSYRDNNDIDEVIRRAKATKELEELTDEIKGIIPSEDDSKSVQEAVIKLAGHGVLKGSDEYRKLINIVADFLGVDLPKENVAESNNEG